MQAARGRSWSTVLALLGAVIACAGCGGDDEQPSGADLSAIRCPLVASGEQGGVTRYEPAEDSFDTAELIGTAFEEARAEAAKHGCDIVVAMEDGKGLPVPADIDPKRIYVYTEDDVVTGIEGVGGGI